jgi:hypothetical protein
MVMSLPAALSIGPSASTGPDREDRDHRGICADDRSEMAESVIKVECLRAFFADRKSSGGTTHVGLQISMFQKCGKEIRSYTATCATPCSVPTDSESVQNRHGVFLFLAL